MQKCSAASSSKIAILAARVSFSGFSKAFRTINRYSVTYDEKTLCSGVEFKLALRCFDSLSNSPPPHRDFIVRGDGPTAQREKESVLSGIQRL